jgi:hypothetical protein
MEYSIGKYKTEILDSNVIQSAAKNYFQSQKN